MLFTLISFHLRGDSSVYSRLEVVVAVALISRKLAGGIANQVEQLSINAIN